MEFGTLQKHDLKRKLLLFEIWHFEKTRFEKIGTTFLDFGTMPKHDLKRELLYFGICNFEKTRFEKTVASLGITTL